MFVSWPKPRSGHDRYLESIEDRIPLSFPSQLAHNTYLTAEPNPKDDTYEIQKPYWGSKYSTASQSTIIHKSSNIPKDNLTWDIPPMVAKWNNRTIWDTKKTRL